MPKLRFSFLVNNEYIWSFYAIKPLIQYLNKKYEVKGIILVPDRMGKFDFFEYITYYIKTFGFYNILILTLFTIKKSFKRKSSKYRDWASLSKKYNIEILESESANSNHIVKWVKDNNIDIMFLHTNQIISKKIIDSVKLGIINKHASLLPSCRGVFPFFWSKIFNIPLGVTFHTISEEIDKGKYLVQLRYNKTSASMIRFYIDIYSHFSLLALLSIKRLINQQFIEPIVEVTDSYFTFPTKKDYNKFKNGKNRIIQFSDLLYL